MHTKVIKYCCASKPWQRLKAITTPESRTGEIKATAWSIMHSLLCDKKSKAQQENIDFLTLRHYKFNKRMYVVNIRFKVNAIEAIWTLKWMLLLTCFIVWTGLMFIFTLMNDDTLLCLYRLILCLRGPPLFSIAKPNACNYSYRHLHVKQFTRWYNGMIILWITKNLFDVPGTRHL